MFMEKCRKSQLNIKSHKCDAHGPRTMLHVFLSVSTIFLVIYGIEGFGVVPDELSVRVNTSIKIRCSVDTANGELNFFDGDDLVPAVHINRVNDTYIEMTSVYSRPVKKNFTCKQNRNNVGLSEVFVDERMAAVENFRCRTRDLTALNCSFNKPAAVLPIKYNFTFAVNGKLVHQSKLKLDGKGGYSTVIKVPEASRSFSEMSFAVVLKARNKFYRTEENFNVKLMENLTPNAIDDVKVMANLTNEKSAVVTFKLPKELEKVANEMVFDVILRLAAGDDDDNDKSAEWKRVDNPRLQLKGGDGFLILDNLDYANTAYAVNIRMKSKIATDNDELWSPFKNVTFATQPKLPETLPQTCVNCFNVMDNGNIVIYWMEVSKLYQNAENFSYLVRISDEDETEILQRSLNDTSMVILANSLSAEKLRVQIFGANREGISDRFSQLYVPLQTLPSLNKALKIRKELVDGDYKISWKPLRMIDVDSYTMIWCHQRNELSNQCESSIKLHNISADTKHFTMRASSSLQFGVAANYRDSSIISGFEWAECTAANPNEIGQVHSMWNNVNAERSITVYWKLHCVDEPIVVGYNITYCALNHDNLDKCAEQAVSETYILGNDEELFQYDIVGLKTYTFYNISVALMSHNRLGIQKGPVMARTLEGAPTAPRDLKATKVNSSSIEIAWSRPYEVNGEAMTYQLWYNDRKVDINGNYTMNDSFSFLIEHLESFTNYTITVVACTSECSESSDSLTLRTALGAPGMTFQPTMEKLDKDRMMIKWTAPLVVGGNLDYFHLKRSPLNDQEKETIYRINGNLRSCIIEGFNCDSGNFKFFIRAVNVDEATSHSSSNETSKCFDYQLSPDVEGDTTDHFIGDWSPPFIFDCTTRKSVAIIVLFILATSSIVFSYFLVKFYQKYLRMKDIHTELPSELDPFAPPKLHNRLKDLDLVKDHVLDDIKEEEDEAVEREQLIPEKRVDVASPIAKPIDVQQRENSRSESFLNPMSNQSFHPLPKMLSGQKSQHVQSAPVTPEKHVAPSEFARDSSYVDVNTGYMKMNPPPRLRTESSVSVDGYLDMSGAGKSLSPTKFVLQSPPPPSLTKVRIIEPCDEKTNNSDYVTNEIKNFIKDSEKNNNGYIGKRASMVADPHKKRPPFINSNGYVGLQQK